MTHLLFPVHHPWRISTSQPERKEKVWGVGNVGRWVGGGCFYGKMYEKAR